jgi:hypothetical protein
MKFFPKFQPIATFLQTDFIWALLPRVSLIELIDQRYGNAAVDVVSDERSETFGGQRDIAADKDGGLDHFPWSDSANTFDEHRLIGCFSGGSGLLKFFVKTRTEGESISGVVVSGGGGFDENIKHRADLLFGGIEGVESLAVGQFDIVEA